MLVGLGLLKLWLVGAQQLAAIGGSIHDDELFVRQAGSSCAVNGWALTIK
jgi:hypothetical protein